MGMVRSGWVTWLTQWIERGKRICLTRSSMNLKQLLSRIFLCVAPFKKMSCFGHLIRMESTLLNQVTGSYKKQTHSNSRDPQMLKPWNLSGVKYGVWRCQIRLKTWSGTLAKIPYPLKWTWLSVKSPLIVCVISVEYTRKTRSMLCFTAPYWVLYGVKLQYGIMKHSRAAEISLTLWVLFKQVIRNHSYSLLSYGTCGIAVIISVSAKQLCL